MARAQFLPELCSGRRASEAGGGAAAKTAGSLSASEPRACGAAPPPSLRDGPPPRDELGDEFGVRAVRLAGAAGLAFGWAPETFWNATPAELGALVSAFAGEEVTPPGAGEIARLQELFPDG